MPKPSRPRPACWNNWFAAEEVNSRPPHTCPCHHSSPAPVFHLRFPPSWARNYNPQCFRFGFGFCFWWARSLRRISRPSTILASRSFCRDRARFGRHDRVFHPIFRPLVGAGFGRTPMEHRIVAPQNILGRVNIGFEVFPISPASQRCDMRPVQGAVPENFPE